MENYAIVFDLDETLGHFSQLFNFWNLSSIYLNKELEQKYFNNLIDLFPLFLRPNILSLMKNIKDKKKKNICNYVMIYTNNTGPYFWGELIKNYFDYKLKYKLFDKIIRAFKINGEIIEVCRTSYGKSFNDLIQCSKLPNNTKVCFIDDQIHKEMHHENVLYIKLEPYFYNEKYSTIANSFYKKHKNLFIHKNSVDFINYINFNTRNHNLNNLNKTLVQKNIDLLLTLQIIKEINIFFNTKKRFTLKKKKNINNNIKIINKTKKKY